MDDARRLAEHLRREMNRVIVGQDDLKTQCLIVLLCRGHALVEGVPGIAKTLTVKTLARLLGLAFQRVQGTSDLMPADVLGTNVLASDGRFRLHEGPAFTELLLVDEINRMPPRTQGALLECMEERQITIDRDVHPLSPNFTVFATQNPVEFEGTYPLPEAQVDRFLAKIQLSYPAPADELRLLANTQSGFDASRLQDMDLEPVDPSALEAASRAVEAVTVQDSLLDYIVRLATRTREWPAVTLGASPRATISLLRFAKALAALDGREYLLPDDVKAAVPPVLRHRLLIKAEADLEGVTTDQVLHEVVRAVDLPK